MTNQTPTIQQIAAADDYVLDYPEPYADPMDELWCEACQ